MHPLKGSFIQDTGGGIVVLICVGWVYKSRGNGVVAATNFPELPTSTPAQVQVRGAAHDLLAPYLRLTCA